MHILMGKPFSRTGFDHERRNALSHRHRRAGGTGLTAALAAHDAGSEVLVLERDASPSGSTAMSTGLIPASGTPEQETAGIVDTPEIFAADMVAKTKGRVDGELALHVARDRSRRSRGCAIVMECRSISSTGFSTPGIACAACTARRTGRGRVDGGARSGLWGGADTHPHRSDRGRIAA
ncbi:FAD-binding protein [Novosphingobium resinovorum]